MMSSHKIYKYWLYIVVVTLISVLKQLGGILEVKLKHELLLQMQIKSSLLIVLCMLDYKSHQAIMIILIMFVVYLFVC